MSEYLKTADGDWYNKRLNNLIPFVLAAFFILAVRLFYLQIVEGEEFRRLSENNCIRLQSIDPPRGLIYDSNEDLLVDNRPAFDLFIIRKDAKPVKETVEKLARYLNVSSQSLRAGLKKEKGVSAYKPILLKSDIGRDALAMVEAHMFDLPGVVIKTTPRRHYIDKGFASHLIGYLSEISPAELEQKQGSAYKRGDYIGKFGVEKGYESLLRGRRGGRQVEVNAAGQVVRVIKSVNARSGHHIYLTIHRRLQKKAEFLLSGKAGAAAAMDPATGRILALASSPSFDQNAFVNGMSHRQWNALMSNPFRPMENKAVQGEYPPASTYKIVTAIAGLEEGIIDEQSTAYCPGHYRYGDRVFRCWKKGGHGKVDIIQAMAQSCDVFFYQTGQKLGVDRLAWYAKACGLGERTGVFLDQEAQGLIPTAAWKKDFFNVAWQGGETLSIAIGQGYNLTTPLQMLVLTAAVANGGTRYKPLIISKIKNEKDKVIKRVRPEITGKLPAGRQTMALVEKGLWEVVGGKRGTARIARLKNITISGKTGTAQLVSRKEKDDEQEKPENTIKAHAWFVAYAPHENPKIAVAVIVEHGEHGSSAAAPIAREMIRTYLDPEGTHKPKQIQ